ncbi:MAG: DUF2076 domain-containing protein [Burkholderiales bacterium]
MTPQERELLTTFLQQMTQAQAGQKDPEAENLIRDAAARQPDALYLLTQRALGLDFAMQNAQAQIAQLQSELDQLRQPARPSFLADANAWGRSAQSATPRPASNMVPNADLAPLAPLGTNTLQRNAPQGMQAAQTMQPAQAMRPAASSWGGAGILGTVAATAAGVAGGALLYQGISSMMHRNDQPQASASPPPEASHLASNDAAQYQSFDDTSDSMSSDSGGDFDGGDSA